MGVSAAAEIGSAEDLATSVGDAGSDLTTTFAATFLGFFLITTTFRFSGFFSSGASAVITGFFCFISVVFGFCLFSFSSAIPYL